MTRRDRLMTFRVGALGPRIALPSRPPPREYALAGLGRHGMGGAMRRSPLHSFFLLLAACGGNAAPAPPPASPAAAPSASGPSATTSAPVHASTWKYPPTKTSDAADTYFG